MTPLKEIVEIIVKEFDEFHVTHIELHCLDCENKIKSFLRSSLNKVIEERDKEILEEIEKKAKPKVVMGHTIVLNREQMKVLASITEFIKSNKNK